MADILVLSSHT